MALLEPEARRQCSSSAELWSWCHRNVLMILWCCWMLHSNFRLGAWYTSIHLQHRAAGQLVAKSTKTLQAEMKSNCSPETTSKQRRQYGMQRMRLQKKYLTLFTNQLPAVLFIYWQVVYSGFTSCWYAFFRHQLLQRSPDICKKLHFYSWILTIISYITANEKNAKVHLLTSGVPSWMFIILNTPSIHSNTYRKHILWPHPLDFLMTCENFVQSCVITL